MQPMTHEELQQICDTIEAADDDEAMILPIPYGIAPGQRAEDLLGVTKVVDELRRRGCKPHVETRRPGNGDIIAVWIERDDDAVRT